MNADTSKPETRAQRVERYRTQIFHWHVFRNQAQARLTIKRLYKLFNGELSEGAIRYHMRWLREQGWLED